jgi:hypothetical protein
MFVYLRFSTKVFAVAGRDGLGRSAILQGAWLCWAKTLLVLDINGSMQRAWEMVSERFPYKRNGWLAEVA